MNRLMLKLVGMSCVLAAATLAAGAQGRTMPKYGVTVTAEKNVDFAKFKTYSWTRGQPSAVQAIDKQITAAVDRELAALGMTKASSGPGDVMAAYYSLTRTDVDLKAKAGANGSESQYSVGTLVVALLDPATRKRLLQLRADKPIESNTSALETTINGVVTEMFAKYPTRQPTSK